MTIFILLIIFIYGIIVGSFLNVVVLRLPNEQNLHGRSHCMSCGHLLAAKDLVPVFSFLYLRGKCRYCKQSISFRYAVIEIVCGLLFIATWLVVGLGHGYLILIRDLILVSACLAVFVVDWEHYLILDNIIFPVSFGIFLFNVFIDISLHHNILSWSSVTIMGVIGALAGSIPFYALWAFSKGRWMGFGDVKLMVLLGLAVGFPMVFILLFIAFILGGLVGICLLLLKLKKLQSRVPFGTFLSFAAVITVFWGEKLLKWYLSLIGL